MYDYECVITAEGNVPSASVIARVASAVSSGIMLAFSYFDPETHIQIVATNPVMTVRIYNTIQIQYKYKTNHNTLLNEGKTVPQSTLICVPNKMQVTLKGYV